MLQARLGRGALAKRPQGRRGRDPSPKRRVGLGRTDHDRREEPRARDQNRRGRWIDASSKTWTRRARQASARTTRQGPQPEKTCRSWKNRSRSARGATSTRPKPARTVDRCFKQDLDAARSPSVRKDDAAGTPARKDV